jgi:hypothetical protein
MADGDGNDLIMKFVLDGQAISAESTTKLDSMESNNPLLAGFEPKRMFEIDRFSFSAGTAGGDPTAQGRQNGTSHNPQDHMRSNANRNARSASTQDYAAWRAGKPARYPGELHPIQFSRSIDSSSMEIMQRCIDCISYDSASLIKRKSAGGPAAGEVFLRLDFLGVLVTSIGWSNDIEVEETCEFICRGTVVTYRPQLPSGKLGGLVSRFWSMLPTMTQPLQYS